MATDPSYREELKARVLPEMTLCTPEGPARTPSDFNTHTLPNPALERYHVRGNAILTGGAGDLAAVNCRALLEHGLSGLAIFDVNEAEAIKRIEELKVDFPDRKFLFVNVDVTSVEQTDQAVEQVVQTLGSIDVLITFAGMPSCHHSIDISIDEWRRAIEVNTNGSFISAQAVAKRMAAAKTGGSIIFIASMSAHMVNFPQPQAAYNTAKAGVLMMKSSLAMEWACYGIRVNSISPGYMDTIMNHGEGLNEAKKAWMARNPLGRMGLPEELTGVVVLLASKASTYINGTDIIVDGGESRF